jgi:hypothetical protein
MKSLNLFKSTTLLAMKLFIKCLILATAFTFVSCDDNDEIDEEQILDFLEELENQAFSEHEGTYAGTVEEGSNTIGTWVALLHTNQIYGVSTGQGDELILSGTEDFPNISGTGTSSDDPNYLVNFSGTLESTNEGKFLMGGNWNDDQTSGTFSGEKIEEGPGGGYTGVAYEGNELVARWVLVLHENKLIGVTTNQDDEIILEGTLSGNSISGTGTGMEDGTSYTISFSGTLEENSDGAFIMSGNWNDDESSGQFKGVRIQI